MAPVYPVEPWQDPWGSWITVTHQTTQNVWNNWTGTSASTVQVVWLNWCDTGTGSGLASDAILPYASLQSSPSPRLPETEEQRLAREERARVAAERMKESAKQRELRARRAKSLLVGALDRKQRAEFKKNGYFHVQTADGERIYRLKPGSSPLRIKSDDGMGYSYCIHPTDNYPPEDTTLALKLLLEADEERFLQIANASVGHYLVHA